MLVFHQKFVSGVSKIKSTIEGLAFDRPCWAIMPDSLRTLHICRDVLLVNRTSLIYVSTRRRHLFAAAAAVVSTSAHSLYVYNAINESELPFPQ